MNAAAQHAIASGEDRAFRDLFEKCARRFHDFNVTQGSVQHRQWKFENCPAEACKSARKALGMRVNPLLDEQLAEARGREPGQEG